MYSDHNNVECVRLTDANINAVIQRLFVENNLQPYDGLNFDDFFERILDTDFISNCTIYFEWYIIYPPPSFNSYFLKQCLTACMYNKDYLLASLSSHLQGVFSFQCFRLASSPRWMNENDRRCEWEKVRTVSQSISLSDHELEENK